MNQVDPYLAAPVAVLATLVVLSVIAIGRRVGRIETETGRTGPSYLFLSVVWISGLLLYLGRDISPFLTLLMCMLGGALAAFGFAIFAVHVWHSLLRALRL